MATPFLLVSGPCLIESEEMLDSVAAELKSSVENLNVELYLKGSFVKANRTSIDSPTTIGEKVALKFLREAGERYGLKTLTDVHNVEDVAVASDFVDALQIPAFLSRQTDLLVAAGSSAATVNIKKGQFMAPDDISHAVEKVRRGGCEDVWVCERGTSFGYHDLVVDMRGLVQMRALGVPVLFDATHSTQRPSVGKTSGGDSSLAFPLARAAAAVGVDGLFFETHPNPSTALSDSATQIPMSQASTMIGDVLRHHELERTDPEGVQYD